VQAFQDSSLISASFTDYVNIIDSSGSELKSFSVGDGPQHLAVNFIPGDANGDFGVDIKDITHIIKWKYKGGDEPVWPKWRANANGDHSYNIKDVTYLIKYKYKNGPRPKIGPSWLMD
jgi:hypothetical protein